MGERVICSPLILEYVVDKILLVDDGSVRVLGVPGRGGVFSFIRFKDVSSAMSFLRPLAASTSIMPSFRSVLGDQCCGMGVYRLGDEEVIRQIANRVVQKRIGIARPVREKIQLPVTEPADQEVQAPLLPPPPPRRSTWIEFDVVYKDGKPVSGLDYILEDPDGIQEGGVLPSNGKIRRDGIPDGTYTLILRDIESVAWAPGRIRCDEPAKVRANVSGYTYGTKAKVKIYRELKETAADVLDTLDGRVLDDRIEVQWQYKYTASDERKNETGIAHFIAEVELEGGKRWAKTVVPLEVELKSIREVSWSEPKVEAGGAVTLNIATLGYADGTAVKLELWKVDQWGQFNKTMDLAPAKLAGGQASVTCGYAGGKGAISIPNPGEYFVVARIEDNVKRRARSELLWCVYQESEDAPQASSATATATTTATPTPTAVAA